MNARYLLMVVATLAGNSALLGAELINLGFDNPEFPPEIPPRIPGPPFESSFGEWVRPGWSSRPQSAVGYNYSQQFSGYASIVDSEFRDQHFGSNVRVPVVGEFSLMVWPLSRPVTGGVLEPYRLTQSGQIPSDAESLRFLYQGNDLRVYVGGIERAMHALPEILTGDPEVPLFQYFAIDVSPFAGQTVELKFEFRSFGYDDLGPFPKIPGEPNAQSHVLDDISFSPLPAVPEPSTWALLGLGAAALAWGRRKLRDES